MEESDKTQDAKPCSRKKRLIVALVVLSALGLAFFAGIAVRHYNVHLIMDPLYELRESLKDKPEVSVPEGQTFEVNVRSWLHPKYRDESKGAEAQYHFEGKSYESAKTALIVIDTWQFEEERLREHAEAHIPQAVAAAKRLGMHVIFAPHGRKLMDGLNVGESDTLLSYDDSSITGLKAILKRAGIRNLIYCGYATNMCVINRPIGLFNMAREGFNTLMIRDATLGNDVPGDPSGEWATKVTIHQIENVFGGTTTVQDLADAKLN